LKSIFAHRRPLEINDSQINLMVFLMVFSGAA